MAQFGFTAALLNDAHDRRIHTCLVTSGVARPDQFDQVLEDVDLFFNNRELNFDNNNLSEFMDVLDGFTTTEDVLFILTTNSLERVEEAIRNRPGRISQCIYMPMPNAPLRQLYLTNLLKLHNARFDNMSSLVLDTEGCTQAFLKELIQRCIQRHLANGTSKDEGLLEMPEKTGLQVLETMKSSSGHAGSRIIGFRPREN